MFKKIIIILSFSWLLLGCNSDNKNYCPSTAPVANSEKSIWQEYNTANIALSSKVRNPIAIACHNCFDNNSDELYDSYDVIESAINASVDIVELDIVFPDEAYQEPMVSHDQESKKVPLNSILSNQLLLQSSAILFIEVK